VSVKLLLYGRKFYLNKNKKRHFKKNIVIIFADEIADVYDEYYQK